MRRSAASRLGRRAAAHGSPPGPLSCWRCWLLAVLAVGCARRRRPPPSTARLTRRWCRPTAGLVRGVVATDHRFFAGIPYAAPPVGPLRWQPPAPVPAWPGVRDATRPGPRCVQDDGNDLELGAADRRGLPDAQRVDAAAVGRAAAGDGVDPRRRRSSTAAADIYDARRLASRGDIVVVTINYRLGALGLPGPSGARPAGRRRQLRAGRPAGGAALGARQHRQLRRRPGQGDDRRRIGGRHVGVRPPRRAGLGGVVPGGDHPERAVSGAVARCRPRSSVSVRLRGRGRLRRTGDALRSACARCRRTSCESRCGTTASASDTLSGPVTGTTVLPVDPMTGVRRGAGGQGAGADRQQPRRVHSVRRAAVSARQADYHRRRSTRSCCQDTFGPNAAAVGAHYPLDRYRRQRAAGLFGGGHRRGIRLRGRPDGRRTGRRPNPCTPTSSTIATRRRRKRCAQLPFPVGASHSLELRYLFDIGGAPPLNPRSGRCRIR